MKKLKEKVDEKRKKLEDLEEELARLKKPKAKPRTEPKMPKSVE